MARSSKRIGDDERLMAAVECCLSSPALVRPEPVRTFEHLRQVFVIELCSWDRMLAQWLDLVDLDAGGLARGLSLIGVPTPELIRAWVRNPRAGMEASVRWLASQRADHSPDIRRRRLERGEDYGDLAESARGFRLRGDGELDGARLRARYEVRLQRSWLVMVGDLLGQVVADAGSLERAATVLAVPQEKLVEWVVWLVSRGSEIAAYSLWPVHVSDELDTRQPYIDLVAAHLRGRLPASGWSEEPVIVPVSQVQEYYRVRIGPWDEMVGELLSQLTLDAGSRRKAAEVIGMARSTLSAKLKRYEEKSSKVGQESSAKISRSRRRPVSR